ncbi:MAG: menaquinone biosynthetic enzyme MqnA/MqnD family protein [Phycisphaerales bacterium]|jgi:chorismate dehydratase|nr:menaquinone biosynthesis protein [Planctomycetota bacterium]
MTPNAAISPSPTSAEAGRRPTPCRLGVVSYLNTLPLIAGLEACEGLELDHAVPSELVGRLVDHRADLALCSAFDYLASPVPLAIVPVGMLGCHGATMTVRLYSRVPAARVRRVHADTDSHTSVKLLSVLLRERYGVAVELVPYDARSPDSGDSPESLLLIGDKVIVDAPDHRKYPHQLDLGEAWLESFGLPFVFATWMCRADLDDAARKRVRTAAALLDRQRRHNRSRIPGIVHRHAIGRGWPRFDAELYLDRMLRYDFDGHARAGLAKFFELVAQHGLVDAPRSIEFLPPGP